MRLAYEYDMKERLAFGSERFAIQESGWVELTHEGMFRPVLIRTGQGKLGLRDQIRSIPRPCEKGMCPYVVHVMTPMWDE